MLDAIGNSIGANNELSPEVLIMADKAIAATKLLVNGLSSRRKFLAFDMEYLMVIAGFKAGISRSIIASRFNLEEFTKERELFKTLGIIVTEPEYGEFLSDRGINKNYSFEVYNPVTLQEQTRNSELVVPFTSEMQLKQWKEVNANAGIGCVQGVFSSYPVSAIKDFPAISDLNTEIQAGRYANSEDYFPLHYGFGMNDGYIFKIPPNQEVLTRERTKGQLFSILEKNPEIQELLETDIIERSSKAFFS